MKDDIVLSRKELEGMRIIYAPNNKGHEYTLMAFMVNKTIDKILEMSK